MVADRQRKVKLLAIEEELARLELEMLIEMRGGQHYLGVPKSNSDKTNDKEAFVKVLNDVFREIGAKPDHNKTYVVSEVDTGTLSGYIKPYDNPGVRLYRNAFDKIPIAGWTVDYGGGLTICIMLAYEGDMLQACVTSLKVLKDTTRDKLVWNPMWVGIRSDLHVPHDTIMSLVADVTVKHLFTDVTPIIVAPPPRVENPREKKRGPKPTPAPVPAAAGARPGPAVNEIRPAPVAKVGPAAPPGGPTPTPAAGIVPPVANASAPRSSKFAQLVTSLPGHQSPVKR